MVLAACRATAAFSVALSVFFAVIACLRDDFLLMEVMMKVL